MQFIRRIIFILNLAFIAHFSIAQNLSNNETKIQLYDSKYINIPISETNVLSRTTNENNQKFKLPKSISEYRILENHLQYRQYLYLKQKQNVDLPAEIKEEIEYIKNDTIQYSNEFIDESIKILSYRTDKPGYKIIVDIENDHDFTNDIVYEYSNDSKSFFKDLIITVKNIEVWDYFKRQKKKITAIISLDLHHYHYQPVQDSLGYVEVTHFISSKKGSFYSNSSLMNYFDVYVLTTRPSKIYTQAESFFYFTDKHDSIPVFIPFNKRHKIGDTIKLDEKYYAIMSISSDGSNLIIKETFEKNSISCFDIGCSCSNITGVDIMSNKEWTLYSNKKKRFTIIEFWGTWCAPCKEILPQLKNLYNRLSMDKVELIGVAYDNSEIKAKDYIAKNQIGWINIMNLIDGHAANSIVNALNITAYPSYILLDLDSKIIFKDEGIDGLSRLSEFLMKLNLTK
jgi:thiol-disulfide isomerase/thioredoxin